jgi:hypothetical protein
MGSGGLHRLKRLGLEADKSFPSIDEVNKDSIYTSTLPYAYMACTRTILR